MGFNTIHCHSPQLGANCKRRWADSSLLGSTGLGVARVAVQGAGSDVQSTHSQKGRVLTGGEGRGNPQGRGQMCQDGSDRWSFIYSLYHFPTALEPTAPENNTTTTPYPSFNGALVSWGGGIYGMKGAGILFRMLSTSSRWRGLDPQR